MKIKQFLFRNYPEIIVFVLGSIFGFFLMFSTFSSMDGNMIISSKAWSDFASHIPLIRSFSLGSNFPVEYPLFPGEPIKYHFIFYYLVGLLEKIGLNIGIALNIPSIIGFALFIFVIYFFAREIFKSKSVGVISVIFFLFNSSLSFVYFLRNNPLSNSTINQIITNTQFQSFAPYGDGIITAFWNLNIYTNQRHLALSFALSLIAIYLIIKPIIGKKSLNMRWHITLGILLGLSFFLHTAVFLMTCLILFALAIFFSKTRKNALLLLAFAGIIAFPQYLYLKGSEGYSPHFVFGYLTSGNLTFQKFTEFWIYNLGLSIVLIPLGFLLSNRTQKKILLSFFTLFIIGNTIQFSPEIAANHKFFNYFIIVGNMFSAFILVKLWNRNAIFKPITVLLLFFTILGGIIDFFPIYNDNKLQLADYKINKDIAWIKNNTPQDSIFLNTTYLYNPASLAGRKIFLGWPYFAWSQGYDTNARGNKLKQILAGGNKKDICEKLKKNNIQYISIENPQSNPDFKINEPFFKSSFTSVYKSPTSSLEIFEVTKSCNI